MLPLEVQGDVRIHMATYGGIAATSNAIIGMLETAAVAEPEFATAGFSLFTSADLQKPPGERLACSLYLYHVAVNGERRNQPARLDAFGIRHKPRIPLDLHYLLTAWAKDATIQQRLLGWAVRIVQDTPTLPAAVLNHYSPAEVFRPGETVEVIWENLSQQELYDIWESARPNQQPSASYVARIVEIESAEVVDEYPLVQTREFGVGAVVSP
jgi:hypothetical protein